MDPCISKPVLFKGQLYVHLHLIFFFKNQIYGFLLRKGAEQVQKAFNFGLHLSELLVWSQYSHPTTFVFCMLFILFNNLYLSPYWPGFEILVPPPGMEPRPPTAEAGSPTHCTRREFPWDAF